MNDPISNDVCYCSTDGASKVHTVNQPSGYGVYIKHKNYEEQIYGKLFGYKITDILINSSTDTISHSIIYDNNTIMKPTNNRAELIAMCILLSYLLEMKLVKQIELNRIIIISDSKLTINTTTTWIHTWKKNNLIESKKNPDIVNILYNLIIKCQENNIKYELVHQESHISQKKKNQKKDNIKYYITLNEISDKLANLGCSI